MFFNAIEFKPNPKINTFIREVKYADMWSSAMSRWPSIDGCSLNNLKFNQAFYGRLWARFYNFGQGL